MILPMEHEDCERERIAQATRDEWAKARERIEDRHLRGIVGYDEAGVTEAGRAFGTRTHALLVATLILASGLALVAIGLYLTVRS